MPAIQKLLKDGRIAIVQEDGTVTYKGESNLPVNQGMSESENIIRTSLGPLAGSIVGNVEAFGQGSLQSATLGAAGKVPLAGSIFEPHPIARNLGRFVGASIPIELAAATGGSLGLGAAARLRRGAFLKRAAENVGTGATLGAAESIAQKDTENIGKNVVRTSSLFGALGIVGTFAGAVRKYFGETIPKNAYDAVLNVSKVQNAVDKEIAGEVLAQRAPNIPGLYGTKQKMVDFLNRDISKLENKLEVKINEALEKSRKASTPNVEIKGTPQIEFKMQDIKPLGVPLEPDLAIQPSGRTIAIPAKSSIEISNEAELLRNARKEALNAEAQVRQNLPSEQGRFVQEPAIATKPVVDALEAFEEKTTKALGSKRDVRQIREIKNEFINRYGRDDYIPIDEAQNLKITEYKSIGDKRYSKLAEDNPYKFQAKRVVASSLRKEIGNSVEGIQDINDALAIRYGIRSALEDQINRPAGGTTALGRMTLRTIEPPSDVALTTLGKFGRLSLGRPSTVISPITKLGLREAILNNNVP